jgi:hypothetical protein
MSGVNKKAVDKAVNAYVKFVNTHLEELGIADQQVISTKLSVEEMEEMCGSIGEMVAGNFEESQVPQDFMDAYNELDAIIDQYKEGLQASDSGKGEAAGENAKPGKPTPNAQSNKKKTEPAASKAPETEKPKKKSGGRVSKQKSGGSGSDVPDKDKAIKKLFDLLPAKSIDELDSATMRTVLSTMK